jgi:hypothetical protein
MVLGYRASAAFDAKKEAEELLQRFAAPPEDLRRLCTVIDVIDSLNTARVEGFNGIAHKWEETAYDGIFIYANAGIVAAIIVPGSGRAQTFDLTLLGLSFIAGNEDQERATKEFLDRMMDRRNKGTRHDWN